MASAPKKSKKILVAEDERPLAHALELKLTSVGFDVEVAFDGEEAIEKLSTGNFDAALLDLVMPRKDGFGVLTDLKQKKISIPVIVSSNLSQQEDFERAKKLGAKDYLVKANVSLTEIVDRIRKLLKM